MNNNNVIVEIDDNIICRICYSNKKPLITPCNCKGSIQYVHYECLDKWRIRFHRNHKNYQRCNICDFEYNVKTSREKLYQKIYKKRKIIFIINCLVYVFIPIMNIDCLQVQLDIISKSYTPYKILYKNICIYYEYGYLGLLTLSSFMVHTSCQYNKIINKDSGCLFFSYLMVYIFILAILIFDPTGIVLWIYYILLYLNSLIMYGFQSKIYF